MEAGFVKDLHIPEPDLPVRAAPRGVDQKERFVLLGGLVQKLHHILVLDIGNVTGMNAPHAIYIDIRIFV